MDQAEGLRNIIKKENPARPTARVITVTSGKGGVGKTNISVNLAIELSKRGKRVVIIDADLGLANVEIMLGIRPQHNLADLMFSGKSLEDIITRGPGNIGFISGGSGIQELNNLTKQQVNFFVLKLSELDKTADIIIIDTGAGINDTVLEFISVSQEVILVATPEPTSITDSYALLKSLNRKREFYLEDTRIKLVANMVENQTNGQELYNKLRIVSEKFLKIDIEFLGNVPQDPWLKKAVMNQKPVSILYPNSGFTKAIKEIADEIYIESEESKGKNTGIAGLFLNLIRKIR